MQNVQGCYIEIHLPWWFATLINLSSTLGISPDAIPPLAPNRPQWVMFPSLCWCVLIVQLPPMSENMQCLVFCSYVSLLRIIVSSFIHVPEKDMNSSFLWLHSIPWYICATFSLSNLSLMGIWVDTKSLLLIQSIIDGHLDWFQVFAIVNSAPINICMCAFIIEWFLILWVYTQ